jgi:hypothetical protein
MSLGGRFFGGGDDEGDNGGCKQKDVTHGTLLRRDRRRIAQIDVAVMSFNRLGRSISGARGRKTTMAGTSPAIAFQLPYLTASAASLSRA